MSESPGGRCGFTWTPDGEEATRDDDPRHQSCCWRETWRSHDRCIWHAETDDAKPLEVLRTQREAPSNRERNDSDGQPSLGTLFGSKGLDGPPAELLDGAVLGQGASVPPSLDGCAIRDATIEKCNLQDSSFRGTIAYGATLTKVRAAGVDATDADFDGATLTDCAFIDATFQGTTLSRVQGESNRFDRTAFEDCTIRDAELVDSSFQDTSFIDSTVSGSTLAGGTFTNARIEESDFSESSLRGAELDQSTIRDSSFSAATLADGSLQQAELSRVDWAEADLEAADVRDANITDCSFKLATLTDTSFMDATARSITCDGARGTGVAFIGATVTDGSFVGGQFADAVFDEADLSGATFTNATLTQADFYETTLDDTDFTEADCTDADFFDASATGAEFMDADLTSSAWDGADGTGAALWFADCTDADFIETTLVEANLQGANLDGATFDRSDLEDANIASVGGDVDIEVHIDAETSFIDATLSGAQLPPGPLISRADLRGASFEGHSLHEYDFSGARLARADFSRAELGGADFTDANLERALLNRADLFDVSFEGARLDGALFGDAQVNEQTFSNLRSATEAAATSRLTRLRRLVTGEVGLDGLRCVYDPERQNRAELAVPDAAEGEQASTSHAEALAVRAGGVYRALEQLAARNALPEWQRHLFLLRKEMQTFRHRQRGEWTRYSFSVLQRLLFGYGERFGRVIGWSGFIIAAFAIVYLLGGWIHPVTPGGELGAPVSITRVMQTPSVIWDSVYYSTLTFTALGFGDYRPVGTIGQFVTIAETAVGAILLALLVFVLGRRAAR